MRRNIFALVDCNNFYVSCERVFNPALAERPVVVLSNNDGCVISRSEEAKAAGVKMGAPLYQAQALLDAHEAAVFSSNYALYGDMSRRVAETLEEFTPEVEMYSIDEAFLDLRGFDEAKLNVLGQRMRETIKRWTGIPVSIGIAETKTLAKVAVAVAKRSEKARGVVNLAESAYLEHALARVKVEQVWGIGPNYARRLKAAGVKTALDLRDADSRRWRMRAGITLERVILELRGTSCLPLALCPPPRRSLTVSRSFGAHVETLADLREAVATFASRAGEKLRRRNLVANALVVFLSTSRFACEPLYAPSAAVALPCATSYTADLIRYAHRALDRIYRADCRFKKAGVMLFELVPAAPVQQNMFVSTERTRRLMETLDRINARMGSDTISYGALGLQQRRRARWQGLCDRRSPRCTTRWDELLSV
ncbi:MAG TPA: Y-family DNA polymerase [Pyrinomonadaceae bacterium]|nr:Y-family DNA polymerase [Pyrinomonadaceae bacterium]